MILLLCYVAIATPPGDEQGQTWVGTAIDRAPFPVDLLLGFALVAFSFALVGALLAFCISGIGWITVGHSTIGALLLGMRGFVSLWFLSYFFSPEGSPTLAMTSFVSSVAMAAFSALALARATRPRARAP
jgi:hypothetical protein